MVRNRLTYSMSQSYDPSGSSASVKFIDRGSGAGYVAACDFQGPRFTRILLNTWRKFKTKVSSQNFKEMHT